MFLLTSQAHWQVLAQVDAWSRIGVSQGRFMLQAMVAAGLEILSFAVARSARHPSPSGLGFPQVEPNFGFSHIVRPAFFTLHPLIHPTCPKLRLGRGFAVARKMSRDLAQS